MVLTPTRIARRPQRTDPFSESRGGRPCLDWNHVVHNLILFFPSFMCQYLISTVDSKCHILTLEKLYTIASKSVYLPENSQLQRLLKLQSADRQNFCPPAVSTMMPPSSTPAYFQFSHCFFNNLLYVKRSRNALKMSDSLILTLCLL